MDWKPAQIEMNFKFLVFKRVRQRSIFALGFCFGLLTIVVPKSARPEASPSHWFRLSEFSHGFSEYFVGKLCDRKEYSQALALAQSLLEEANQIDGIRGETTVRRFNLLAGIYARIGWDAEAEHLRHGSTIMTFVDDRSSSVEANRRLLQSSQLKHTAFIVEYPALLELSRFGVPTLQTEGLTLLSSLAPTELFDRAPDEIATSVVAVVSSRSVPQKKALAQLPSPASASAPKKPQETLTETELPEDWMKRIFQDDSIEGSTDLLESMH